MTVSNGDDESQSLGSTYHYRKKTDFSRSGFENRWRARITASWYGSSLGLSSLLSNEKREEEADTR